MSFKVTVLEGAVEDSTDMVMVKATSMSGEAFDAEVKVLGMLGRIQEHRDVADRTPECLLSLEGLIVD